MPKFLIVLGIAMLVAGLAAVALAIPYIVLERGFTQVIVGTSVAASGLVLAVLGTVLREVRGLRALVVGLRANAAVDDAIATAHTLDKPDQPVENNSKFPPAAMAGAGAAVLAGGLVVSGMAKADAGAIEIAEGEQEADPSRAEPVIAMPEPVLAPFLPGIAPDMLTSKIDHAVDDLTALRRDLLLENDTDSKEAEYGAERTGLAPSLGTELAGSAPLPLDYADDFSAMLDEPALPLTPRTEAAAGDEEGEPETVVMAELAVGDLHEIANDKADEEGSDEDEVEDTRSRDSGSNAAAIQVSTLADKPDLKLTNSDQVDTKTSGATISQEGILSVHTVGSSTFTMYANGTIRAETPDGLKEFDNVAELKEYLAQDKAGQPLM